MLYRFYFSICGCKHYEEISADSFRQARNTFFEHHKTAKQLSLVSVWSVCNGELIDKIY